MKKSLLLFLIPAFIACSDKQPPLPTHHFIPGVAAPLRLAGDNPELFLTDFVPDPGVIDSVWLNGRKITVPDPNLPVLISVPSSAPRIMELRIWSQGDWQSVVVLKSRKVNFEYTFDPAGKSYGTVQLSADFNGWTPSRTNLELKDGKWSTTLSLDPGRYQYQLVLDGKAGLDPDNPDSVDNNIGGFNSLLKAGLVEKALLPFLFTAEAMPEEPELEIGWDKRPAEVLVLWQNILLDNAFIEPEESGLSIQIPSEAAGMEYSWIRVFAYNDHGLANDLLIPLKRGKVVTEPSLLDRTDPQSRIIYNVFVDRFFNGDPGNDEPINDPALVLPQADFHGGDIAGITRKLKEGYFTGLGVNTIWISPVVLNPNGAYGQWNDPKTKFSAYHGYWPISFTKTDPRFGTSDELKELVREAHARGINVLLDFVAHHVHELHPYYIEHPNWTTSLYLPDGTLNTEKWDEHRLTTWFDIFLPTLDLQQPEVTGMLSDSATWWIREYGLDGFRHDATKHIPEIFWRALTKKLKQQVVQGEGRYVYQIGETYGGPQLISSYLGAGMLDGQFDFNVYDAAVGVFAREGDPFTYLDNTLQTSFDYYGRNNLMGYITGNQDRGRFISYAGGDLKFSENAKAAGWTRNIGVGDDSGYRKLSMLTAFNMTIPGLPVIYYGDEVGIPGGNDPDSRRMMKFDGLTPLESATRETAAELAGIRNGNLALTYGNFMTLLASGKSYVYARQYFNSSAVVLFNKRDQAMKLTVKLPLWLPKDRLQARFGSSFSIEGDDLTIDLAPWSFDILTQ
jgi:glycosidase